MNSACITPPRLVIRDNRAAQTDEVLVIKKNAPVAKALHEPVLLGSRRYRKNDMRPTHTRHRVRIPLLRQVAPPAALSHYQHSHETTLDDETLLAMETTEETVALEPKAGVAQQSTTLNHNVPSENKTADYIPSHQENITLPLELLVSFNELSAGIISANEPQLETYCLPERLTFTADDQYENNCINMSELRDKFDDNIVFIQKYGDDAYLIKTPSTNLWFKKTDAGSWKLSEMLFASGA